MAALTNQQWRLLCGALELDHLVDDPTLDTYKKRGQQAEAIHGVFEAILRTKPRDQWLEEFEKAGLPAGPVLERSEVMDDPIIKEHAFIVEMNYPNVGPIRMAGIPLRMSLTPGEVREPPPQLGEHTDEVLRELQYSTDDIQQMRQAGAVA